VRWSQRPRRHWLSGRGRGRKVPAGWCPRG
jgi:hypothetical protein